MKKIIILSKNEINAVNGGTASPVMRNKNTNTSHLDYKSVVIRSAVNVLVVMATIAIIAGIKSGINYCKRDRLRGRESLMAESVTAEPLTTKKFELMMYSKLRN